MKRPRSHPLRRWRFLAQEGAGRLSLEAKVGSQHYPAFDELVVHDMGIHLESMDDRSLSIHLGPGHFYLSRRGDTLTLTLVDGKFDAGSQMRCQIQTPLKKGGGKS